MLNNSELESESESESELKLKFFTPHRMCFKDQYLKIIIYIICAIRNTCYAKTFKSITYNHMEISNFEFPKYIF